MNFWLYSHLRDSPGNKLVQEEALRRGHQCTLVRPEQLTLRLDEAHQDRPLVYTRTGSSAPLSALAKLSVLEGLGYPCVNRSHSLHQARDKAITYSKLAGSGVPCPRTVVVGEKATKAQLSAIPGPPWIVKLAVSTKGQGVCLVESERSLRSVVDALREASQLVLLQEFIEEARGSDIRVLVLGGKARVAARRQAAGGDEFRSNIFLGGQAEEVELEPEMARDAEAAAQALELDIAGVDLLPTQSGYSVVEVNGSPGLTASPRMPGLLVDFLELQSSH